MPHERTYEVSRHARERLAERYSIALTNETWDRLVRGLEEWPYELSHCPRHGAEVRVAHVQVQHDGLVLVLPIVYRTSRWAVVVITVKPDGIRLRRHRAAKNT